MTASLLWNISIWSLWLRCVLSQSNTTNSPVILIKIGGLFNHSASYLAFLQAIDAVNDDTGLLNGYSLHPVAHFHETNWIIEAADILSQNLAAVIAPPTSLAVKQISPLFSLATTPLMGYSATASILSDTDIVPYFYRVTPDVSDLIGLLLNSRLVN